MLIEFHVDGIDHIPADDRRPRRDAHHPPLDLLAEAQGGEVRYRDAPAGGAVFSVTMPIASA